MGILPEVECERDVVKTRSLVRVLYEIDFKKEGQHTNPPYSPSTIYMKRGFLNSKKAKDKPLSSNIPKTEVSVVAPPKQLQPSGDSTPTVSCMVFDLSATLNRWLSITTPFRSEDNV